ncbi:RNA polymerase sigma factor [Engelhardtia mirabilis]|uniref:ECF RNA polymerase sigma factor SigE n=1 Tax=Engelhardtia mirabilis TaxID=2528011 RepID=A0A518BNT5_9BACT|nr:ECF RNA polymerase sigma factor SigE [Planctomycetes bacterium Pla133]QDV02965.1 ECF RNA polymerase sigma factor SigE [Planctomycetes bacterium Pla86]
MSGPTSADRGSSSGERGSERVLGDPQADLALTRGFLSGSATCIHGLGERLRIVPRILRGLNARSGRPLDEHDLADLVQDTATVILRKLDRYDGRAEFDGWVYGICRFEFLNAARGRRRRPRPVEDVELELPVSSADGAEVLNRISADIDSGLATLTDSEREVVRMKHFDDLTFESIGERLGCSPNTAKTRYYRGLTKLQEFMEPRRKEYEA